ncbi:BTB domain containing protein [Pyrenophora tritici-repentis]|uniref:BTB domain containing protein n=1 Tax=Pyrenophora tritici-repentis TaxID=45151 RepID=A0A2W1D8R2_9PLEO|nr:BTB domain-containing protein [Pyrenophora tritici-repentis]KAF7454953.1 BTB domain containing protein [Pyrenophora tritici-repentis]KAF7578103.1 BTB domain containing protein [Pyrenophora tritici-repentis]KAG9388714.1 BTB domain containing protein [Pyrenophora tritici-repentis]KAI1528363.1 BTB domain containing protein [Pyrenophora tritici-repentis]
MAELAREDLNAKVQSLLITGDYSDFVITCGVDIYNVHKAIVCTQSGFFQRAERFPAGKLPLKEAAEDRVNLPEDHPAIIKLLVQFLYEGEYEPKLLKEIAGRIPLIVPAVKDFHYVFPHTCEQLGRCRASKWGVCHHHDCNPDTCGNACRGFICKECTGVSDNSSPDDLILHAKMYQAGDKYDVPGLKMLSREKFSRLCVKYWDHELFPTACGYALSSTPDEDQGLRKILCETILAHTKLLKMEVMEEALGKHIEFVYQVTKRLVEMREEK